MIGINQYDPNGNGESQGTLNIGAGAGQRVFKDLDGCVNDAQAMRDILVSKYGFSPGDIEVLLNGQATRDAILSEIQRQLIDNAAPGDVCVFYFAGHGSRIRNLKSNKPSGMDSTIVPADSMKGVMDIRDKELARLFNKALNKKVVLTAIFDSCDSGSIARGLARNIRSRYLPPSTLVVSDPADSGPTPEQRGALIFSATQDDMDAVDEDDDGQGTAHGAFTSALLRTLESARANASADELFLSTEALLHAEQPEQVPVLAGTLERRQRPLFGSNQEKSPGLMVVGVDACVPQIGQITLAGGRAIGLEVGCQLRRLPRINETPDHAVERIQVIEDQGLSKSVAKIVSGDAGQVKVGDLFVVDHWVYPSEASLRVWLDPSDLTIAELRSLSPQLATLQNSPRIHWVTDPTLETPAHVLSWTRSGWSLSGIGRLGRKMNAQVIIQKLTASASAMPGLFVDLPIPREMTRDFQFGEGSPYSSITATEDSTSANYILAGQWSDGAIKYGWIRPDSTQDNSQNDPLPVRTDWIAIDNDPATNLVGALESQAVRLGRLKAWLTLSSPPNGENFPYHLELLNTSTKQKKDGGDTVLDGEPYGLVLVANPGADLESENVTRRWIYVVGIDSWGNTQLLFPAETQGNVGNHLPFIPSGADQTTYPSEMLLGDPLNPTIFTIGSPFGVDSYVLLTSDEPIMEPAILEGDGVRTRGAADNPLASLLANVGAKTRAAVLGVPSNWSIQRISIRSTPKSP